jgi:hypothetical protein
MIPNAGKYVLSRHRISQPDYSRAIAEALRLELGGSGKAAKTLMKWTGANERTVRNWLSGGIGPNGKHLVLLCKESDAVWQAMMRLSGRSSDLAALKLGPMAKALAHELMTLHTMLQATPNGVGR